jgi:hypothetical protein
MPKKMTTMKKGDKKSGKLRWGGEERSLVREYFEGNGKVKNINHAKIQTSADYRRELQELEEVWARHPRKNFDQTFKRLSREWIAAQQAKGAHRKPAESSGSEKENGGETDADDEDDSNSEDDESSE